MLDFGSFSLIRQDSREVREAVRHPKEVEGRGRDRETRRGGEAVGVAFLHVVIRPLPKVRQI